MAETITLQLTGPQAWATHRALRKYSDHLQATKEMMPELMDHVGDWYRNEEAQLSATFQELQSSMGKVPARRVKGYRSRYTTAEERTQAKHTRIRNIFDRLGNHCNSDELVQWLADRFYVSPSYISTQILKT